MVILVFGLPESPRYCYKEGRRDEALQILSDVYGRPKDDPKILAEQAEILEALAVETQHGEFQWRYVLVDTIRGGGGTLLTLTETSSSMTRSQQAIECKSNLLQNYRCVI